jgi:hypothetical protein
MTDASDDKRDFFVSFNQADRHWATWIAWVLEEKGYSAFFQDWDFRGSFIEQMHQASLRAGRTLVVLSDHYLHSRVRPLRNLGRAGPRPCRARGPRRHR